MLLQVYCAALTGYKHLYRWPWLEESVNVIRDLPEHDGLIYLAERIWKTIHEDLLGHESVLVKLISRYLERGDTAPLRLEVADELPSAVERLDHHLQSLV